MTLVKSFHSGDPDVICLAWQWITDFLVPDFNIQGWTTCKCYTAYILGQLMCGIMPYIVQASNRDNEWINEWINELNTLVNRTSKWLNWRMNEWMDGWMDGRTNERMNEWIRGWMNGWMNDCAGCRRCWTTRRKTWPGGLCTRCAMPRMWTRYDKHTPTVSLYSLFISDS